MDHVSTTETISYRSNGLLKRRLLERGQHMMVTERFGYVDPQQKNNTKTSNWRRYHSAPRATAPLADGIPPEGTQMSYTDISCTLEMYGALFPITDQIQLTHEDPVLKETVNVAGEQIGETIEEIRINFMKAGTNVFYADNAAARTSVNSPPTRGDFRRIYRYFKSRKAKEMTSIISPSGKISTEPVPPSYFVLGHTDLDSDIRSINGFIPYQNYSDPGQAMMGEIGSIEQFRIILTAMFTPWLAGGASGVEFLSGGVPVTSAASADVYPLLFIAKNSYAIVPLQGFNSAEMYVKAPGDVNVANPLGQIGFVSWKTFQGGTILNQDWIARLECAATATPD